MSAITCLLIRRYLMMINELNLNYIAFNKMFEKKYIIMETIGRNSQSKDILMKK
jgi:hypothetical protein